MHNFQKLKDLSKALFAVLVLLLVINTNVLADDLAIIEKAELKGKSFVIQHNSSIDLKFKKRIYENPARLVFDLLNSDLKGKKESFTINDKELKEIRLAQFEPSVARVVIESTTVSSLDKIKISSVGQKIYFDLGVQDLVVKDVSFDNGNLLIQADSPVENTRTIELTSPERLVVDLIGAKLKDSTLKKTIANGEEEIRVAQFDDSTVRVVFSGKKSHKREIKISADKKQILIEGKNQRSREESKDEDVTFSFDQKISSMRLVAKKDAESIFSVRSTEKIDYKFLKLHHPERLVIDIFNVGFDDSLLATQFPTTEHIQDIRFGVATIGKPVTRIVLDLKQENLLEDFSLGSGAKELTVKIIGKVDESPSPTTVKAYNGIGRKVVIDAGHGGYDPGAVYGGKNEKDITLSIAQKIKGYLEDAGVSVYMTRSEDRFVSLAERVEVSNSIKPNVFVSVHVNALATNTKMDGLQTYHSSQAGYGLASVIHRQLLSDVGMPNRNVRKAGFWVTKHTQAPSILLELGFMTNPDERKKLASDNYQNDLAKSVAKGIIQYLETH